MKQAFSFMPAFVLRMLYEVMLVINLPAIELGVAPAIVRPSRLSRCPSAVFSHLLVFYARLHIALMTKVGGKLLGGVRTDAVLVRYKYEYRIRSHTAGYILA